MNERGKKLEPKLKLNMPFGEAIERFMRVKTHELNEVVEKSKSSKNGTEEREQKPHKTRRTVKDHPE